MHESKLLLLKLFFPQLISLRRIPRLCVIRHYQCTLTLCFPFPTSARPKHKYKCQETLSVSLSARVLWIETYNSSSCPCCLCTTLKARCSLASNMQVKLFYSWSRSTSVVSMNRSCAPRDRQSFGPSCGWKVQTPIQIWSFIQFLPILSISDLSGIG